MATLVSQPTQSQRSPRQSAGTTGSVVLRYALLIVLAILFLIPFYLIVRNGLATEREITSPNWTFFPSALHFENISELFSDPEVPFLDGLINSAIISVLQTAGQILLAALSVITFIGSWNAFLWPLVIGQDASAWTVQVVLSNFLNAQVLNLHELFIGATIGILPLVIIFFFLQRYIVEGYKQSGLKG